MPQKQDDQYLRGRREAFVEVVEDLDGVLLGFNKATWHDSKLELRRIVERYRAKSLGVEVK
jgi:hypothetical protein